MLRARLPLALVLAGLLFPSVATAQGAAPGGGGSPAAGRWTVADKQGFGTACWSSSDGAASSARAPPRVQP